MLPEEQELARLTNEQDKLVEQVTAAELSLNTERTQTQQFQRRYYATVGKYFVEIDQLDAELAALKARVARRRATAQPDDNTAQAAVKAAQAEADDASARAHSTADETRALADVPPVVVTPEIKAAYRQACKLMHPDRATNDAERVRRTDFMARVNVAYEKGDQAEIERVVAQFGTDPEALTGNDIGTHIIKSIRRSAQLRRRLTELATEWSVLQKDEVFELRQTVESAEALGGKPLSELAVNLLRQISEKRIEIELYQVEQGVISP
jgi:hypothetical protein